MLEEIGWEWPEESSGIMSTRATYKKMPAVAVNIQDEKLWIVPNNKPIKKYVISIFSFFFEHQVKRLSVKRYRVFRKKRKKVITLFDTKIRLNSYFLHIN